ncbi:MAG: aldolase [Acidobacteria bacterium]|nr:MAG: aldolase [Acidobacteriota bacterium]
MAFGDEIVFTLFTNDAGLAARADAAGIDRVGVDLERIGKAERQAGLGCRLSDHRPSDLVSLAGALERARLFARTNPPHPGLKEEVGHCLALGASVLMLPMFETPAHAESFVEMVGGRAEVVLLVETPEAARRLPDIVRVGGVAEIHVGLNDLALGLGAGSHFEVLASDLVDRLSSVTREAGLPFGVGGVGRLGDDRLPVPADLVYAQYPRLGAMRALVSRVFLGPEPIEVDLVTEVRRTRDRLTFWSMQPPAALEAARDRLRAAPRLRPTVQV